MVGTFLVGVSIILVKDEQVLIAKRAKNRFATGIWEFPSGRLDKGEDPFQGAIREAKEELNITLYPVQIIDAYTFQREDKDLILLSIYCEYKGDIIISDEHDELKWVSLTQAEECFSFPQQKISLNKFKEYLSHRKKLLKMI